MTCESELDLGTPLRIHLNGTGDVSSSIFLMCFLNKIYLAITLEKNQLTKKLQNNNNKKLK